MATVFYLQPEEGLLIVSKHPVSATLSDHAKEKEVSYRFSEWHFSKE